MNPLLKVIHVFKTYKMDGLSVSALDDISLEILQKDFVAIMGPSGSGKSTLMHIIGCLDTPTSGQIIINKENVSQLKESELAKIRNREIGFVFQSYNLLAKTTALQNVELPLIYSGIPNKKRHKLAYEALVKIGLSNRINHLPSQLSGGQQQRVAIARALVTNPSIILADEPTGNIDSKSGKEIMETFKNLNESGHTIILVTHDQQVANWAKRIIRLQDGKIISS